MKLISFQDIDFKQSDIISIALGNFDGIHVGHKKVLKTALKYGKKRAALLTFNQSPKSFFEKSEFKPLLSFSQKCKILEKMGFYALIVIDFSDDFSRMSGEEFVNRLLRISSLRYLIAGADFQCGHNRATNIETIKAILKNQLVTLKTVPIDCKGACKVSSTLIRELVLSGQFRDVKALTGRDYILELPTCNAMPVVIGSTYQWQFHYNHLNQLFPKHGIFKVTSKRNYGMISVSNNSVILTLKKGFLPPFVRIGNQIYKGDLYYDHIRSKKANRKRFWHK